MRPDDEDQPDKGWQWWWGSSMMPDACMNETELVASQPRNGSFSPRKGKKLKAKPSFPPKSEHLGSVKSSEGHCTHHGALRPERNIWLHTSDILTLKKLYITFCYKNVWVLWKIQNSKVWGFMQVKMNRCFWQASCELVANLCWPPIVESLFFSCLHDSRANLTFIFWIFRY